MKVRSSVKRICKYCFTLRRTNGKGQNILHVDCPVSRKHRQRQG